MHRSSIAAALIAAGCSTYHYQTHAYVASTRCGQGPYDFELTLEGHHPEGVEVIACTPRQLAGYTEVTAKSVTDHATSIGTESFGDKPDNQRCVSGQQIAVATNSVTSGTGSAPQGAAGDPAAAPKLVEQAFVGQDVEVMGEDDALCRPYGLHAQHLMGPMMFDDDLWVAPGNEVHVRLWSDTPNDLERVVFLMRDVRSSKALAKGEIHELRPGEMVEAPPPVHDHGAPPSPLAEERPPSPSTRATWVPGYWTWTGDRWGWMSGFWRDEQVATPASRVEVPGAPPAPSAVWITGAWQLRGGTWVWTSGRWR